MTDVRTPEAAGREAPAAAGAAAGKAGGSAGATGGPATSPAAFGVVAWARWGWRQLTSMRVALVLLFLLALGSVPGSLLPQQGIDPAAVQQYYTAHPALAPVLNALGLFNVFGAPWFAAIYLLLFVSLAGCVLPRTYRLARSARALPPRAPKNLSRLPHSVRYETPMAADEAARAAAAFLSRRRFRLHRGDGWLSAEKGYRREAGNLLFHVALMGVLVSIGLGGMFGYKADRLLVEGSGFADTITDLDAYHPGHFVSPNDLAPFSLTLDKFSASYIMSGPDRTQPLLFNARVSYNAHPGAPTRTYNLRVNHPLNVDSAKVYLIGHGYAPIFRVTDGRGHVVYDQATPFLPVDQSTYLSEGVVKVPDAQPQQLGFAGIFMPTAIDMSGRLESAFPAPYAPAVSMIAYSGNLGLNSGVPQSVYQLNTNGMRRLPGKTQVLTAGQSMKLPNGAGTLTFLGYRQWASLQVTYDPGQVPALISGAIALCGLLLSFLVRRRRIFVRAYQGGSGGTVVEVGGLARSDVGGGFETEFAELAGDLRSVHGGTEAGNGTAAAAGRGGGSPAMADGGVGQGENVGAGHGASGNDSSPTSEETE
ncbi:MAG TPA: cytochrome c biogenesis protein ResB [Streptosporangiaceae bacterium]|nr:cytochrome c biogenesis protein ResB [Streptosporangiaceae bacterium]